VLEIPRFYEIRKFVNFFNVSFCKYVPCGWLVWCRNRCKTRPKIVGLLLQKREYRQLDTATPYCLKADFGRKFSLVLTQRDCCGVYFYDVIVHLLVLIKDARYMY